MDSRCELKIHFEIYDEVFDWECSINYFDDGTGMDPTIEKWFQNHYEEAREKWEHKLAHERRADEADKLEDRERAELARLTEKYA